MGSTIAHKLASLKAKFQPRSESQKTESKLTGNFVDRLLPGRLRRPKNADLPQLKQLVIPRRTAINAAPARGQNKTQKNDPVQAFNGWQPLQMATRPQHIEHARAGFRMLVNSVAHSPLRGNPAALQKMLVSDFLTTQHDIHTMRLNFLTCSDDEIKQLDSYFDYRDLHQPVETTQPADCARVIFEVARRQRTFLKAIANKNLQAQLRAKLQQPNFCDKLHPDPYGLTTPHAQAISLPHGPADIQEFLDDYNLADTDPRPKPQTDLVGDWSQAILSTYDYRGGYLVNGTPSPVQVEFQNRAGHTWSARVLPMTKYPVTERTFKKYPLGDFTRISYDRQDVAVEYRAFPNTAGLSLTLVPGPRQIPPLEMNEACPAMQQIVEAVQAAGEGRPIIPPMVHFIWLGGAMPEKFYERILSFQKHNPDHTINVWTDLTEDQLLQPKAQKMQDFCSDHGLRLLNAPQLLMPTMMALDLEKPFNEHRLHRQYGAASDILRVVILKRLGGTYADTDRVCIQPLGDLRKHSAVIWTADDGKFVQSNDFMMVPPNHPLMDEMVRILQQTQYDGSKFRAFTLEDSHVLTATGPRALSRALLALRTQYPDEVPTTLMDHHLGTSDMPVQIAGLTKEVAWVDEKVRKAHFMADEGEDENTLIRRLTVGMLLDFVHFKSVDIHAGRYARYLEGHAKRQKRVLEEVARHLLA